MPGIRSVSALFPILVTCAGACAGGVLSSSQGFESGTPFVGLGAPIGVWGFDKCSFVSVSACGGAPYAGNAMLEFDGTTPYGAGSLVESNIYQVVDVSSVSPWIAYGNYSVNLSGYFDRCPGPASDTQFVLRIRAFSNLNDAVMIQNPIGGTVVAASIFTDATPGTWEYSSVGCTLPPGTIYVGIEVAAHEDVLNNLTIPEFSGHYADEVELTACCFPDYNLDGAPDFADVLDLSNDIASGSLSFPPNDPDFNCDGALDFQDVLDLATVVSGGPCP